MDPAKPSVVFVGRITQQKGLVHLLDAERLDLLERSRETQHR